MPTVATIAAFAAITAVFAAIPGPSNLYVVAEGLRAGRRPALLAAVGCACGAAVYVGATTAGLAALLASSATMLSVLHYAGGAYLIWLGIRSLRGRAGAAVPAGRERPLRGRRAVRRGLLVELSNPKVALFFLAFFPQFVHPDRGAAWSQILVLGALFCLIGLISDSLYAITAGSLRAKLRIRTGRLSGPVYLGLGAWAIWSGTRSAS